MADNQNPAQTRNEDLLASVKALTERLEAVEASNASLQKSVDGLTKENAAMKSQLKLVPQSQEASKKVKPTVPDKTFEVEGKTFKFKVAKFHWKGGKDKASYEITALDALNEPSILEALVNSGSELIKEVE